MKRIIFLLALIVETTVGMAQIGEHRSDLSLGINGGYMLTNVGFNPEVPQDMLGGFTFGVSMRYTCEKYFKSICSLIAEVNYAQIGWKERIQTINDAPVVNPQTGLAEAYSRKMNYVQVPLFARLGWGKERKGFQFFFQAGPQFGVFLNEKTEKNFETPNMNDRSSKVTMQDSMSVENKFDYGIAAGLGLEYSNPKLGHFMLEGRYYYGLGDFYGNSKRDYFGRSNFGTIVVKLSYLFDLLKTKNETIK